MKKDRLEIIVWRIGFWPIIYQFISILTQYIAMTILCIKDFFTMGEEGRVGVDQSLQLGQRFAEVYEKNSSFISMFSVCLTLPVVAYFFRKEQLQRQNNVRLSEQMDDETDKTELSKQKKHYVWIIFLGMLACSGLSRFISILPLDIIGGSYAEVEQTLYNKDLWVQIATIGFLVPIIEEIIYRGMVYNHTKDYVPKLQAMIISSLIFGLFHFNLMQGCYAACIGALCCFVYEAYNSLKAPILLHVSANCFSMFLNKTGISRFFSNNIVVYWIVMLIELFVMYLVVQHIYNQVSGKKHQTGENILVQEENTKQSEFDIKI